MKANQSHSLPDPKNKNGSMKKRTKNDLRLPIKAKG